MHTLAHAHARADPLHRHPSLPWASAHSLALLHAHTECAVGYFQLNKTCQLCPDIPGWVIPVAILVLFFVAVWLLKALASVKMEDLSSLSIAISYWQHAGLYCDFNLQCVIRMTPLNLEDSKLIIT